MIFSYSIAVRGRNPKNPQERFGTFDEWSAWCSGRRIRFELDDEDTEEINGTILVNVILKCMETESNIMKICKFIGKLMYSWVSWDNGSGDDGSVLLQEAYEYASSCGSHHYTDDSKIPFKHYSLGTYIRYLIFNSISEVEVNTRNIKSARNTGFQINVEY